MVDEDGNVENSYQYDTWGNLENSSFENTPQPIKYAGEYFDNETGLYYLRARYYDPKTGRFTQEDPVRSGNNWYIYAMNNPVNRIDPLGLEYVVVSGGNYGESEGYKYNFIEPAIKKIRELRAENSTERIGWVIANAGWTSNDWKNFQSAVSDLNVNIIVANNKNDFVNYINCRNEGGLVDDGQGSYINYRTGDEITKFAVYSHGRNQDTLALGFDYVNYNTHLDFTKSDISQINVSAFSNSNSWFYSCYHAIGNDDSFAATWHKQVNSNLTGAYDGQTTYKYIMYSRAYFDYWATDLRKIAERNAINAARKKYGFSANGSFGYPEAASGVNQVSWSR
jgi:RHS repeat-associated protein